MSYDLKLKQYEKKFIEMIEKNKKIINNYKEHSYEIRQKKILNILYEYPIKRWRNLNFHGWI